MAIIYFGKQPNPKPLCACFLLTDLSRHGRPSDNMSSRCAEELHPDVLSKPPLVLITSSIITSRPTCLQSYLCPVNIDRLHYAISVSPRYPIYSIQSSYCGKFIIQAKPNPHTVVALTGQGPQGSAVGKRDGKSMYPSRSRLSRIDMVGFSP